MNSHNLMLMLLLPLFATTLPSSASAQRFMPETDRPALPVPGLDRIGVDEHLEADFPLDISFRDHSGAEVSLRDYFDGERPVLLNFAYHTCTTLCSFVLDATADSIKDVEWTAGDEYQVVTISIDPNDTPASALAKRQEMLAKYGRDGASWAFLVGDEESITRAAQAAGFRYFYNANQEIYAHPAAIMFLTPDAKVARYLYGLRFESNDVRTALLEASEGRSISTAEQLILYCYAYDPDANGYALVAMNVMKLGGALTVLLLGSFLAVMWRRERRRSRREQDTPSVPRTSPNQVSTT